MVPLTQEEEAELRGWAERHRVRMVPLDYVDRLLATLDEARKTHDRWVGVTYGREASDSVLLYRETYEELTAAAASAKAAWPIGRCGCTIHEDRGVPCGYTGPSSDYRDPLSQVCDTCLRVCWGASL